MGELPSPIYTLFMSNGSVRGPYAKGVERRREILDHALGVFAERGFSKMSLRAIAAEVDSSHAAVRHYFPSLEGLLLQLLERHDAEVTALLQSENAATLMDELILSAQYNSSIRGMIAMHTSLLGRSVEPDNNMAKAFFADRYETGRETIGQAIEKQQAAQGANRPDPRLVASVVMAAFDGLQIQWLLDPSFDLVGAMRVLEPLVGDAKAVLGMYGAETAGDQ